MITLTLLYVLLWFVFGGFFGFKRTFEAMFFNLVSNRSGFNITISPMFLLYVVGIGALAVS